METERLWRVARESFAQLFRTKEEGERSGDFERECTQTQAWVLTGLPYPDLNMGIVSSSPGAADSIRTLMQRCHSRQIACLLLSDGVDSLCDSLGLERVAQFPLMALESSVQSRETVGLDLGNVECGEALLDCEVVEGNQAVGSAFGLPAEAVDFAFGSKVPSGTMVRVYTAKKSGRVVASLRISEAAGVSGVWCMATEVAMQRQGFARSLLQYTLLAERARGIERFVLIASPQGRPLYEKIGFVSIADASVYLIDQERSVNSLSV